MRIRIWIRIQLITLLRIRIHIFYLMVDLHQTFQSASNPDPNSDPSFQIKAQTLEKMLKKAHIPGILACHLQIDADADPVLVPGYQNDADTDPQHCMIHIHTSNDT